MSETAPPDRKHTTRVALITGSTDGIGRATARRLARDGWEVVVNGRSEARCAATVDAIRADVPGARVSALAADLSDLGAVRALSDRFAAAHDRLDLLLLNANSITQRHARTRDGFEKNFAVGYLNRALLCRRFEPLLRRTEGAAILSVVGLNLERLDFDDPIGAKGFSSMKALGYWQWAVQVFARAWNERVPDVPMNTYMPGLVKTKILAHEPQPFRLFAQVATMLFGVSVERSGDELAQVADEVRRERVRDEYYARTKRKGLRELKERPGDRALLWERTEAWLAPWLGPPSP
ncbi:MAG: SDR family NAD(P)-dependent oxidoreductase [Polyangiales bacterium]